MREFSFRSRKKSLERFENEVFDFLVIGGGITGAAVARDAAMRGLKVALVERKDFAYGTSSRSSKLIHGGLRYLENFEFGLVFEALSERALLLKSVPHVVKPLPFYWPVYTGDIHNRLLLSLGLWFYDALALFRSPGFHQRLSKKKFTRAIPFLNSKNLKGGFRYYDAYMWDDVLTIETLRAAQAEGAAIANYVEALEPIWTDHRVSGFYVRDLEKGKISLRAHQVISCVGPWTDELGEKIAPSAWDKWLMPSKGVHLIFDLKKIPLPGALVMSHPRDGRISFVIPRPDYGAGVVIVGTTDGPTPQDPDQARVEQRDIDYLMDLLQKYFPELGLKVSDIVSTYVGVRPLIGNPEKASLQTVSREHHIEAGPGGVVFVAGGKYTTHRKMAEEIVGYALEQRTSLDGGLRPFRKKRSTVESPSPQVSKKALKQAQHKAKEQGLNIPPGLWNRYGADALLIMDLIQAGDLQGQSLEGFPELTAQLRYAIQNEMVMRLEDFYLRRIPLYATRKDHGLPWAKELSQVWAKERGLSEAQAKAECDALELEIKNRCPTPF